MVPDRRGIQFAQILNTLAADEAMVNATRQLQKRGERVLRNLFPSTEPHGHADECVNDPSRFHPSAFDTGDPAQ